MLFFASAFIYTYFNGYRCALGQYTVRGQLCLLNMAFCNMALSLRAAVPDDPPMAGCAAVWRAAVSEGITPPVDNPDCQTRDTQLSKL